MIIGTNIAKSYRGELVFEDVSFKLGNGNKIGLVGANGCGKSTLFKLIVGLEYDSGSLHKNEESIGYIPQEFSFPDVTAGEFLNKFLDHDWESYRIDMLVNKLRFSNYNSDQQVSTLSEGQKMKLKMISTLLGEPTVLLIDEPTMLRFVGNYDNYKEEKFKLIEKMGREYKIFLQKKASLERLLLHARRISDGKARGRAVSSAKKRIIRETEGENAKTKYTKKQMGNVTFQTDITHRRLMLGFKDVTKKYDKNTVFEDLSFSILGGEKVWIFGPNGAGKTTIIKLIMGEEKADKGVIKLGEGIKVGYFAQKQTFLNDETKLLDQYLEDTSCDYGKSFGNLQKFLFTKDDLKKKIKNLSPGQKARFAFAIFAYNDYDFLILDEPTNHLDIETKEVIEESLSTFNGTMLLVSHDRYFVERVGITKLLNLRRGKLEYFK